MHSFERVEDGFWGPGSPNDKVGNNLDCGFLHHTEGQVYWLGTSCHDLTNIATVCQRGVPKPRCPTGWSYFNSSCYYLYETGRNWHLATENCKELHPQADLASIHAAEENNFVQMMSQGLGAYVWLGGTDFGAEGQWQ